MSNCVEEQSIDAPVTLQGGGWSNKGRIIERYYIKVERCGTKGSYTFKTLIYRKGGGPNSVDGWAENEQLGFTYPGNGKIILDSTSLEPLEEAQLKRLKNGIKGLLKKAKKWPIGNDGLTHAERTAYLRQLGFQNVAEGFSSNPQGLGKYVSNGIVYDSSTNEPIVKNKEEDASTPGFWETYGWDLDGVNSNLTNINIEGRQFRDTYKNLHYPEGLGSNRQDRIRFTQKYTQGRKVNLTFDSGTKIFQRDPEIKIDGSVTLPIVTGIGDRNAVDWKDESLNPIQALAAGAAVSVFENVKRGGLADAFKTASGAFQEAQGEFKQNQTVGSDMAKAINVYLAQSAVGAQGLLSRATGAILNPNLEMLFGGPKLRSFGFTFKLSPRDASEASQVRQILRFFKQGMSVKTSSSNVFLKAPNVFDIQYQTFNTDGNLIEHPSINFIKTCALTSCDVQYTPDGTYMTYEDPFRTMTSYQLTLNFGELDPIFDDDYTELDDNNDQILGY